jgi:electron transfer flavoprotein beta subunit
MKVREADQSGVELANIKVSMNPFDGRGEEALKIRESGKATEVIGFRGCRGLPETLRTRSPGADRAIW